MAGVRGNKHKIHSPDILFLISLGIIIFFGLIVLIPSSFVEGCSFGDCFFYVRHQIIFGLIPGLFLFWVLFFLDYHWLKRVSLLLFLISLVLVAMVFIPYFGLGFQGSRRWINFFGIVFQPSEILKLSSIIYLSAWLESKKNYEKYSKKIWLDYFFPFIFILGIISFLLIKQPDLSTLVIILCSLVLIYFLANSPWRIFFVIAGLLGIFLLLWINFSPYRFNRLLAFLYPEIDPQGAGYHSREALSAIASGGLFGKGLSHISSLRLPEVLSDSTFALACQGLGFIGAFLIIFFYFLVFWRGHFIARYAPDRFGYLLANGICFCFVIETLINLGAILRLLPLTGTPLPLMSYGGTSMIVFLSAFGILANISRQTVESD
ncbi:FtsW/RodA/SpoVE family cell cycle protein [bacterium]|nr:FtsW/RodA/SpoVE family cell cycle protein [bacterium]